MCVSQTIMLYLHSALWQLHLNKTRRKNRKVPWLAQTLPTRWASRWSGGWHGSCHGSCHVSGRISHAFSKDHRQMTNSSTSKKGDEVVGDVFHSIMNQTAYGRFQWNDAPSGPEAGKSHPLNVLICKLWKGNWFCVNSPIGSFLRATASLRWREGVLSIIKAQIWYLCVEKCFPIPLPNRTMFMCRLDTLSSFFLSFDGRTKTLMLSWFH